MSFDDLIEEAQAEGIEIYEKKFESQIKGLYVDGTIALDSSIETIAEKMCVLAEELGHHYTTVGNIVDQTKTENRKQELIARRWAIRKLIRLEDLIKAYKAGVRNKAELAEFLNVTEQFLDMAIAQFKYMYGLYYKFGNYIIGFEPLMIYKLMEDE